MAKANDTFKPVLVATPKTEMIFVKLLQEATYEGDKQGHYEATMLMNPNDNWDDVRNAVAEAAAGFKGKWHNPIRSDAKDWLPEGWEYIKIKKTIQKRDERGEPLTKVNIVDGQKRKLSDDAAADQVFNGMHGRAALYIMPYTKGGNGVTARIDTIQALGGERRASGLGLLDVEDTDISEDSDHLTDDALDQIFKGKAA